MTELFKRLLQLRGVGEDFLQPRYLSDNLVGNQSKDESSEILSDLELAARRICMAVERDENILIYGDYDADGVTASIVMYETLKMMGAKKISIMVPDRFKDGYGMSRRCVERAEKEGVGLVVTVDCGSNNTETIAELSKKGIETVVTDHHELAGELPVAVAVVNPKRKDCHVREDVRNLAGVGVAFMVVRELMRRGKIPEGQEKWMLDLVLIGTICDSMVLKGINRELCYYGMKVLAKTRRVGLKELIRTAGVKKISTEAVGFQLGPRINAAGRMASAEIALKLLMTDSAAEAAKLAEELEELNTERKKQQTMAVAEVSESGVGSEPVIVASGEWHEGILGIIAGRLVEEYGRPAFALAEVEPGIMKGSGRSFGDFSLAEALENCKDVIIGGGGHAAACGVKLKTAQMEAFRKCLAEYYNSLKLTDQTKHLLQKEDLAVTDLGKIDVELVDELKLLEPYGVGNSEPVFLLRQVMVQDARRMGVEKRHLRLTLRDSWGKTLKVVAFYAKEDWLELIGGEIVNAWVVLTDNEWNGIRSAEGRLVQLEKVEAEE